VFDEKSTFIVLYYNTSGCITLKTDRQIDRQTDGQTDRQIDRQTDVSTQLRAYLSHYIRKPSKIMLRKTLFVLRSVLRGTACKCTIKFCLSFGRLPLIQNYYSLCTTKWTQGLIVSDIHQSVPHITIVDRDNSVGTATRYGLDGPGIKFR
jgi:hypothetical protein